MTNEQAYAKARKLTAANHHQQAVLVIAEHFKLPRIAKTVRGVIMIHEALGHMPAGLCNLMHDQRAELYDYVETVHGPEARKAVYDCF